LKTLPLNSLDEIAKAKEAIENAQIACEKTRAQENLADVGEIAATVSHEFNNWLNTVLLHVAILEREMPEKFRADLGEIRRQGAAVTEIVRQFQHYRQNQRPPIRVVDLNRVIEEIARPHARAETGVFLRLAPDLPGVAARAGELERLCSFLIRNAVAASVPSGGIVTLRTLREEDKVQLHVEDTGPRVQPALLPHLFEGSISARPETSPLELAACKMIARRLQGTVRAGNLAAGGLAIVVELPAGPGSKVGGVG
jgi:signal transduction histidine kinase